MDNDPIYGPWDAAIDAGKFLLALAALVACGCLLFVVAAVVIG